jgi:hypothetical protein
MFRLTVVAIIRLAETCSSIHNDCALVGIIKNLYVKQLRGIYIILSELDISVLEMHLFSLMYF